MTETVSFPREVLLWSFPPRLGVPISRVPLSWLSPLHRLILQKKKKKNFPVFSLRGRPKMHPKWKHICRVFKVPDVDELACAVIVRSSGLLRIPIHHNWLYHSTLSRFTQAGFLHAASVAIIHYRPWKNRREGGEDSQVKLILFDCQPNPWTYIKMIAVQRSVTP